MKLFNLARCPQYNGRVGTITAVLRADFVIELDGSDKQKDEQARRLLRAGGRQQAKRLRVTNSEVFLRAGELEMAQPNTSTPENIRRGVGKVTRPQLESIIAGV